MTEQQTTARAMIEMLRRHYLPESKQPGGIFAPEIQAPASSRRADLIWQGVTSGTGYELVGHEVKVTRADLLAELDDPTKSDAWMRYCDRWYLVLPSLALMEGLDLPPTWGVMTPPSGRRTRTMTIAVKAPALKPHEQSPALRTLAAWLHWRGHLAESQLKSAQHEAREMRQQIDGLHLRARPADGRQSPLQRVVEKIVGALGVGYGDQLGDDWQTRIDIDDVVAELKDLGAIRARAEDLQRRIKVDVDSVRRIREGCDDLLAKAKAAAKPGGG